MLAYFLTEQETIPTIARNEDMDSGRLTTSPNGNFKGSLFGFVSFRLETKQSKAKALYGLLMARCY